MADTNVDGMHDGRQFRLSRVGAGMLASLVLLFAGCGGGSNSSSNDAGVRTGTDTGGNGGSDDGGGDCSDGSCGNVRIFGASLGSDWANSVASGESDTLYASGVTRGDLDDQTNSGGKDGFLVKFSGDVRDWARLLGTSGEDVAQSVALDDSGNLYVVGWTAGDLGENTNSGNLDAFVAKYDTSGNRQWVRTLGTSDDDRARSVVLDGSGNILVGGGTKGALGDDAGTDEDWFLAKYDPSGNRQWLEQSGERYPDIAYSLATDGSGNLYVAGEKSTNAFVAKFDLSGSAQWTSQLERNDITGDGLAHGIAADGSGNIYVTGQSDADSIAGESGSGRDDAFLAKFNASGERQWFDLFGDSGDDRGRSVSVDSSGNPYTTGNTYGFPDLPSSGETDAFVTKHDASGNRQWARLLGSSDWDYSSSILVDGSGKVHVVGNAGGDDFVGEYSNDDAFLVTFD